ncbi:MAG: hypothetical protein O7F76_08915, partial [Planctomycetota bacterium]|nr:hypothetical protein [Planctomycetota bacterium]
MNPVPYDLTLKLTLTPTNGPDCSAAAGELPSAWTADRTQLVPMPGDNSLDGTVVEVALTLPLLVPVGKGVMFEVLVPNTPGADNFTMGGNGGFQSDSGFIAAGGCGFATYSVPADLPGPLPGPQPNAKFLLTLVGIPQGGVAGACCETDGTCAVVEPGLCFGTFQGGGTACDPGTCLGGCCRIDGTCTDGSEDACDDCNEGTSSQPGVFQGHGTTCADPIVCLDNCPVDRCPNGMTDEVREPFPCAIGMRGNDGCNQTSPAFEDIFCGETKCGQYWYDASLGMDGERDTDWWRLVLTDNTVVSITVEGAYGSLYGLAQLLPLGSPDCADTTGFIVPAVRTSFVPCDTPTVVTECLPVGTYYIFVAPDFPPDPTCDLPCAPYQLSVSCEPGCNQTIGCDVGSTGQPSDTMGHGDPDDALIIGATSDQDGGFQVAGNFLALETGFVTKVRWWGLYIDFGAGTDCATEGGDTTDGFTVTFYNDDVGGAVPGSLKAGPFTVDEPGTLTKQQTGRTIGSGAGPLIEFVLDADIDPPVAVTEGECLWMSAVNNTSGGSCTWLWGTAPPGDGFPFGGGSAQTGAPPVPGVFGLGDTNVFDVSWCVDIQVGDAGCLPPDTAGACCDPCQGSCVNVDSGLFDCTDPNAIFTPSDDPDPCANDSPPCVLELGACCNTEVASCFPVNCEAQCLGPNLVFTLGMNCPGFGQPEVDCVEVGACCLFECPFVCLSDVPQPVCAAMQGNFIFLGGGVECQPPDQNQCGGNVVCCKGDANQDGVRNGVDIQ